jgi:hypothetical protein
MAPLPHQLEGGELEQPAALQLALQMVSAVAEERVDLQARQWVPESPSDVDIALVRNVLSSKCLIQRCQ